MGAYDKQPARVKKACTEIINIVSPYMARNMTDEIFFTVEDRILKILKNLEGKNEENRAGTTQNNGAEF